MRYGPAERLLQLALEMQAAQTGLTIPDIMDRFEVSRRTAIRMRDAVIRAFPQADEVKSEDRYKRWRLNAGDARALAGMSADDLASLDSAARLLDNANMRMHADQLRTLGTKVRAFLDQRELRHIDPDLEALLEAEGIAHRPGPRPQISALTVASLRESIKSCRLVSFKYARRHKGNLSNWRTVSPLGLLYGHRHYLVATDDEKEQVKLFSLCGISDLTILNDSFSQDPQFDFKRFVANSFGVFQEAPVDVIWRFSPTAAPIARQYIFHNSQKLEDQDDGSLIVRFTAGGQLEMAWHLMSWGREVEVIAPETLKRLLPSPAPQWPALP